MIHNLKSSFQLTIRQQSLLFPISRRHFNIFTNETLKKAFDTKVKERYLGKEKTTLDEDEATEMDNEAKKQAKNLFEELDEEGWLIVML